MEKLEQSLNKLHNKLYNLIEENELNELLEQYYISDLCNVIDKHIDQTLSNFIDTLLENEQIKNKLIKQVKKSIIAEQKKKEQMEKESYKKSLKLWQLTKGKIPCICQCGYHVQKTKKQVLEESNTFICKNCSEKAEQEGKSTFDILHEKGYIYDIFNIK